MDLNTLTIYTCCLGGCDIPFSISSLKNEFPDIQFIAFVDLNTYDSFLEAGWDTRLLDKSCDHPVLKSSNSSRLKSRIPKLFPNSLCLSTQYAVWVDANVSLSSDSIYAIYSFLNQPNYFTIACFSHPKRSTIISEILYCYAFGKLSFSSLTTSLVYNLPHLFKRRSLFWGGVIVWNLSHPHCSNKFQNELLSYTSLIGRDQLVLYTTSVYNSNNILPLSNSSRCLFNQVNHLYYQSHALDPFSNILSSLISFLYNLFKFSR